MNPFIVELAAERHREVQAAAARTRTSPRRRTRNTRFFIRRSQR